MSLKLDQNASSPNRVRRNWQKLVKSGGVGTSTIYSAPLALNSSTNTVTLTLDPNGGLYVNGSSGLAVSVDGSTIQCSSNTLSVPISPFGGLSAHVTGLGGTPGLAVTGFQQLTVDPSGPNLATSVSWFNTTQNQLRTCLIDDGTNAQLGSFNSTIFTSATSQSVSANTSAGLLAGYTAVFPANFLGLAGRSFRITVKGFFYQVPSGGSDTWTINWRIGGQICFFWTVTVPNASPNDFILTIYASVDASSGTGKMRTFGNTIGSSIGAGLTIAYDNTTGYDPTVANTWDFTISCNHTNSDAVYFTSAIMELLY